MKILITGATGFVGRRLVERLKHKFPLKVISRSKNKALFAQKNGIKVLYGDLLDKDFMHRACKDVDCVVHFAATFTAKRAIQENIAFMRNIISSCHHNGVGRVIFMSSINSRFKKQGPYSLSKRLCEEELVKSGLDYVILRPTLIYDDNGGIFLKRLLRFIKKFRIAPVIGTGEYQIQPVHVDDVVAVTEKVLFSHRENAYDLAGPDILTYNSLTETICESLGIKRKIRLHLPLRLLKYFGPFIGIGRDKILEIDEDKTADPKIIKEEFGIPLIALKRRLGRK